MSQQRFRRLVRLGIAGGLGLRAAIAGAQSPIPEVPADSVWREDISSAPLHPDSATVISWLEGVGGWGSGTMRIDFSIEVLHADGSAPFLDFTPTGDFFDPDCGHVPVPVPAGGALEGEDAYECTLDGDCHLLVVHDPSNTLYEMWRADIVGTNFNGGRLAVWDLDLLYPAHGRGEQCLSADAAGFPIARAMQKYGLVLADGGTIALTAKSDRFTTATWAGLGIDSYSLGDLAVTDFEIIDTGPAVTLTYNCVRSRPILLDGFELGNLSRWTVVP